MSTKPDITLARWADLAGSFVTDAPSGLRDTGFLDDTPADADIVNAELKQLYLWAQYLSDGALSGNHSIAGTLGTTGLLTASAGIAVPTGQTVNLAGSTTLSVGGGATVGGQALTFTSFTFTANASTDQLTASGHPLQTGDGPVRTSNSGGGLPGGLAAATDYWAIRIDANTFQLAVSFAKAVAGIAIDLTSNGTGTQTLAATGSTTRPTDATVTRNLTVGAALSMAAGKLTVTGAGDIVMTGGTLTGVVRIAAATASVGLATGTTANWSPAELQEPTPTAAILRFSGTGSPVVTGLSTDTTDHGRLVHLVNVGSVSVVFSHEAAGSGTNAFHFHWPTGADITVAPDQALTIWYDATTQRWRLWSKNF